MLVLSVLTALIKNVYGLGLRKSSTPII